MRAVLIPETAEPVREVELPEAEGASLAALQELVGGHIEALSGRWPVGVTAYGNDEAKFVNTPCDTCGGDGKDYDAAGERTDPCRDCHGSGYVEGMAENVRATALIYGDKAEARKREAEMKAQYEAMGVSVIDATSGDPREPFIAGPIVVTGFDPNTGETVELGESVASWLIARWADA
jgi:hypothetical protein